VRRSALALAGSAALVALLAGPASAAVKGRIVSISAKSGAVTVVFSAAGLAENQTIDPSSVRVTLGGETLVTKVEESGSAAGASVVRRVMLTMDTSGSMAGARIAAARQAATAYLNRVPADVEVGLVTFSSTARLAVAPTKDRARVRTAVQRLQASGDTALYDAVSLAVRTLGSQGDRSIFVLSDGKDEGSRTTVAQDVASLRRAKIPLNAVLLGDTGAQAALQALSGAAGGRVVAAGAATELTRAFERAAAGTDNTVLITATLPKNYQADEAPLTVSATAAGQAISDTALAVNLSAASETDIAAFGPRPVEPLDGPFRNKTVLWLGLLALFLGAGGVLAYALNGLGSRSQSMGGRLSPYVDSGARRKAPEPSRSFRESAVGYPDEHVNSQGLEEALGKKLDSAGIPLKPAEWLIIHIGIVILLPLMVLLLSNVNLVLTLVAVLVGVLGPLGYLTVKGSLRTRKFLAQLPDTLQLLSGSLSAGYSLPQAVDAVVRQGGPPISDELRKALVEARLGAPIEDALDDVADRMSSKDFSWVVMAIRVQRQVGGNLAEVLATTAATLRERERLRRQVQVLSAEGRLSAYVLFGLPVVFSLYLLATRPGYLKPLITDPIGWVLLGGMAIFLSVGGLWLRKVVQVEV
jgi:tight adherence protein B